MSRTTIYSNPDVNSSFGRFSLIAGLLGIGLGVHAFAQSVPFPTYSPGMNLSGSQGPSYSSPTPNPWVVSDGKIITPAGTQVYLGTVVRAKAVALNPTGNHTAAVLNMGTSAKTVTVFNTQTGAVLQNYVPNISVKDAKGSSTGITYTPNGNYLLISQDGGGSSGSGEVDIAAVNPATGLLKDVAQVFTPLDATTTNVPGFGNVSVLNSVTCTQTVTMPATNVKLPGPVGTTGSAAIPCGVAYSGSTSYPLGVASSPDSSTAYVVLDASNELAQINLSTHSITGTVRVGNIPNSVLVSADGKTAYVSNEGGRIATASDFQLYSDGTPVVATNPSGSFATGTVSVVDLGTFTVQSTIPTGLHPTGMAFWTYGNHTYLLVANVYGDSLSVIDTTSNTLARTINLGLPIAVPGSATPAFGGGPNSIAVDQTTNLAYVALYGANAVAEVNLVPNAPGTPLRGMIPVGYGPSSVVLDKFAGDNNVLLVANDKGIGSTGFQATPAENSTTTSHGSPAGLNTHQDLGTVSLVPLPAAATLSAYTKQVYQNNHWDLIANIQSASGGSPSTAPVAIPVHIGDPSLIKHIFVIIRENRTYDQILGDVVGGNGQASLAVFGASGIYGNVTPNAHALVQRFPLFDNFYDPSRQSADGHNWIVQAFAPYSDDIQSPDWSRDYPSNGGDAIAYQPVGNLYNLAVKSGVSLKNFGEYVEENTFNVSGCTATQNTGSCEPTWQQFYQDTQCLEGGPNCAAPGTANEATLYYQNAIGSYSPLPDVMNNTVQNYPQFDLGIPDQYRFDIWNQVFQQDLAKNAVPQLELMWISSDHTGGLPTAQAMQADNDLALGRFVDAISHSSIWSSSAIFVEEDDAQDGVDHVDGHRSPGYIFSPYVKQQVNPDGSGAGVTEDSVFYTQVNMTRTIEQILGMTPMNQMDLVASPMSEIFINNPPQANFLPWTHVPNSISLYQGTTAKLIAPVPTREARVLQAGWLKKKAEIFAGKQHVPDSEDPDTVRHYNWYEATAFVVPYPGEKTVRPASDFNRKTAAVKADLDDK